MFTFAFDSYSSIKRVERFLRLGDVSENFQDQEMFNSSRVAIKQKSPNLKIVGLSLKFENQKILDDINLEVQSGEFLAIVGEVGSGKSLLLFSLMREVAAQFKEFKIGNENMLNLQPEQTKDFFTFVSQDGFIMSSSLRENIVFEYEAPHWLTSAPPSASKWARKTPSSSTVWRSCRHRSTC